MCCCCSSRCLSCFLLLCHRLLTLLAATPCAQRRTSTLLTFLWSHIVCPSGRHVLSAKLFFLVCLLYHQVLSSNYAAWSMLSPHAWPPPSTHVCQSQAVQTYYILYVCEQCDVCAGASIAASPLIALSLLAPEYQQSFAALLIGFALSETWRAPAAVLVRDVSPPELGATGSALHLCISKSLRALSSFLYCTAVDVFWL